jgi:RNA polymerase sigma-70 factor (ECF subfamily)
LQENLTDIIEGCKKNEARAQEKLYRFLYTDMFRVCLRYSAGDADSAGSLYNQGMLKVFRNIGQYRSEGEFGAWVRRIMVHVCIDHFRTKARFSTTLLSESTEYILPVVPDIYQKLSGNDVMKLINELPRNTGLVFNLFVMEGYRHQEIARLLGIAEGTSKWHLNEARRILKDRIENIFRQKNLANAI